ncbi:hypothetical protein PBY51_012569 [Eleginops maclovinus]|uniref:Uncharacterized protein n=1 Tax=Eleginops maclovinus TaxID=56733 RepID=A0AAN7Y390_ELEMC|nr:hypothetical protein PBY51_012569 [Eleginops maclovinus]
MFVSEQIPLHAKHLCTLFDGDFSVQGRNRRDRENMTICFWRDWLIDIEEGECSPVTLEKVFGVYIWSLNSASTGIFTPSRNSVPS